jgi:hypothetical protein
MNVSYEINRIKAALENPQANILTLFYPRNSTNPLDVMVVFDTLALDRENYEIHEQGRYSV